MSRGWLNLHGHSHGRLAPLPLQMDVGLDAQVWGTPCGACRRHHRNTDGCIPAAAVCLLLRSPDLCQGSTQRRLKLVEIEWLAQDGPGGATVSRVTRDEDYLE